MQYEVRRGPGRIHGSCLRVERAAALRIGTGMVYINIYIYIYVHIENKYVYYLVI